MKSLVFVFTVIFFFGKNLYASSSCANYIEREFLVTGPPLTTALSKTSRSSGLKILKTFKKRKKQNDIFRKTSASTNDDTTFLVQADQMEKLKSQLPSHKVQRNCVMSLMTESEDRNYIFQKWFFDQVNFNPFKDLDTAPEKEVIIAISDTGVNVQHPDLKNSIWTNEAELNGVAGEDDDGNGFVDDIYGYDFGDQDNDPVPKRTDFVLDYDHGTHVAGLASAQVQNTIGVASFGENKIKLMALKGFKSNEQTSLSDLLQTIYYAVDNGAHIINASWGAEKPIEAAEVNALNYATQNGVLLVAAAGNSAQDASLVVPASLASAVTVGATNSREELSTFTNFGASVDLLAPGGDGDRRLNEFILSTGLSNNYIELRGTSMSAPIVSAAIGLLMTRSAELTAFQALHILKKTAKVKTLAPYLESQTQAYKLIDLGAAFAFLENNENIPEETPPIISAEDYESRTLASVSKSGSGCSRSNSSRSYNSNTPAGPFMLTLFFLMPIFLIKSIKKALKIKSFF